MFVMARAITWATLFVATLLVFLPARILARGGVVRPETLGPLEIAGFLMVVVGAAIDAWCVLSFATLGKGTPAPFDPPRRLVVGGPYRYVRNPMYLGAVLALLGVALVYRSWAILVYAAGFGLVMHLFAVLHEEPALRRSFGADYDDYCSRVRRWWPGATSQ